MRAKCPTNLVDLTTCFAIFLSHTPPSFHVFSSAPCSQTLWIFAKVNSVWCHYCFEIPWCHSWWQVRDISQKLSSALPKQAIRFQTNLLQESVLLGTHSAYNTAPALTKDDWNVTLHLLLLLLYVCSSFLAQYRVYDFTLNFTHSPFISSL